MPRLRRVEHDGRGGAPRAARPRRPRRRAGRREAAAARRRHRRRGAPPHDRSRGAGPRAGGRARRGLGRAGGRRPGHRKVDARPPGLRRARAPGPPRPLRRGRGVAGAGAAARRPPRHGRGGRADRCRDGGGACGGADRRDASRRRRRRLDPNAPHRRPRLRARQRGTGARVGGAAGRAREGERRRLLSHRPRDQGGHARRPARARAPGRHRPLLRGRRRACAARAARRQEPLRLDQRGGGVRDGGGWARRGPEPVGRLPRRAAGRRAGLGRAGHARGQPPPAGRDPGPRVALGARHAAPDRHRPRPGPRGAPPRRARAGMTFLALFWLNVGLLALFAVLLQREGLLGFAKGGKWYLTWFAVGLITLMDELTSIFYAPAEAHRFIGLQAIFFIAGTSLRMRVLSTRMVACAQILELHDIRGGGVYSFSYFVLGPVASFVAVASIMVSYILTACISTVSAVINGTAFLPLGPATQQGLILAIIWAIAGLNILGIRENARVTFVIFIVAAFVLLNLIALGLLHMAPGSPAVILGSATSVARSVTGFGLPHAVAIVTVGIASCILAYSGIESVIQTAGLCQTWRDISKAYWFLALTVGIVTPLISALALSAPIDFARHEGDLIPHWATVVGNVPFGVVVGLVGSVILVMAVNTAYVASSELLERVAHRYRFDWLEAT